MRGKWAQPGARTWLRTLAGAVVGAVTLALTACSSVPNQGPSDTSAPAILAALQAAGVRDLRGSYRAALCRRLRDDGASCDDVLLRLPGEEALSATPPMADLARRYRVAFVPGLFADCVGPLLRPFAGVERDLAQAGVDVHYLPVAGRGTSAANAERLASQVAALPDDVRRAVRLEWWRQHRATISVPVFSLVTMPRPDHLTPFTAATYHRLASIDPLNDGMLFWYDQILPGSHLLGFVNADHWSVVQSAGRDLPIMGVLFRDGHVPRTLLVEAAIEVVDNI